MESFFEDFCAEGFTIIFILLILFLMPTVFYFISLQRALEAISAENRLMPPGQVWLSLISIFNIVWMFFV